MDWISTPDSSNIVGFTFIEPNMLIVEFKHGGIYKYMEVPKHEFEAMKAAESKGQYLNSKIKGYYEFERVDKKQ